MDRGALARKLRDLRLQGGLSQEALGALLGRPQSYVSKVETQGRRVELSEIEDWARACGAVVTLGFLDAGASPAPVRLSAEDQALISGLLHLLPRLPPAERLLLEHTTDYLTGRVTEGGDPHA